ncbi:MAG: tetratricopeptide repeat protein [bacterium]|nr:tetratricopeptide repeat protein [bacterium]
MNKLFYIAFASFLLASCKAPSGAIQKSDAVVSAKDYPYIESFHKGLQYKVQGRTEEAITELEKCLALRTDDDAVYYALSKLELERGNPDASQNYIQKAHEIDPENIWYIEELAYMYFEKQDFEQSAKQFKKLVDKEPRNIDWQYAYSEALTRNGQNKEALEVFNTMEAQVGKHPHFALQRYAVLMQSGDKSGAEEVLLKGKEEFPTDANIIGALVDHYYQVQQNDKAEMFLMELVEADPENGRAHLALADIYQRKNEMDKAYNALKMAVESPNLDIDTKMRVLINIQEQSSNVPKEMYPIVEAFVAANPESAKAHSVYGDYLLVAERNDEALDAYLKAVELDGSKLPLWNQVMVMQYEKEDFEGLYQSSKECLELFPTASTVYLLHGISANNTERFDDAVNMLSLGMEMVVNDAPLKAEMYGQLGEAYFGRGEVSAAIDNYKKALELDNNNYSIKNNYARRLAMLNRDLDLAQSLSDQVSKVYPDEPIFVDTKGMILFSRGKFEEAEEVFGKAMFLAPKNPIILEHLADAQAKNGNKEGAVQNWKLAKEYGSKSKTIDRKIADKKYYAPEI